LNDYAGLPNAIELAKLMGITTLGDDTSRYGLSFALGAADVRVIDMATAYGVLANGGYYIEPSVILRIEDSQGNILYQNNKNPAQSFRKKMSAIWSLTFFPTIMPARQCLELILF